MWGQACWERPAKDRASGLSGLPGTLLPALQGNRSPVCGWHVVGLSGPEPRAGLLTAATVVVTGLVSQDVLRKRPSCPPPGVP